MSQCLKFKKEVYKSLRNYIVSLPGVGFDSWLICLTKYDYKRQSKWSLSTLKYFVHQIHHWDNKIPTEWKIIYWNMW